ncbi:MAG: glycoside hydrolase family 16 protein [Clostridia bacterium]|nr:glycoside hydrolase family 16 protein [Clostridia bacterium]
MFSSFAKRQLTSLHAIPIVIGAVFKAFVGFDFKKAGALITAIFQLVGAAFFDTPVKPYGEKLDMNKFELVWQDEFENGFDDTVWQGHYVYGDEDTQLRDTAWWNREQVSFSDDGCLLLSASYREDGPKGAGYYSYGMETNPNKNYNGRHKGYEQLYGYFEVRCILPKGAGLNPSFWILTDGMWADDTDGGVSGCEIDLFETLYTYDESSVYHDSVYQTVHVDSYEEHHRSEIQGYFYADDPYNKFNTYGVEWNEDGYIFYINGVETARTDFAGVCEVPLYFIISLGVNENIVRNEYLPSVFKVDYVRAYQYKETSPVR